MVALRPLTRRRTVAGSLLLVLVTMAAAAAPSGAQQTFLVTTNADTVDATPGDGVCANAAGACSLRAAVMEANALAGADTITLPAGSYVLSLPKPIGEDANAATGDLDVRDSLAIEGAGSTTTTIAGGPGWDDRIVEVRLTSQLAVSISGVRLTGGNPSPTISSSEGGAIYFENLSGELGLRDVHVIDNAARQNGGGAHIEVGTLRLDGVVFEQNTAGFQGGGINIDSAGTTIASDVTFRGNIAVSGGGWETDSTHSVAVTGLLVAEGNTATQGDGGGALFNGSATLGQVRITGNSTVRDGGGIAALGNLTVAGGRIADNIARYLGGGLTTYGGQTGDTIALTDLVIDGNTAENGGGIFMQDYPGSQISIERVAITDNRGCVMEISGPVQCRQDESIPGVNQGVGGAVFSPISDAPILSSVDLVNVTFSGNAGAPNGFDAVNLRVFTGDTFAPIRLTNVTVARNGRPAGFRPSISLSGPVQFENVLIGANTGTNCSGGTHVRSLGGNLETGVAGTNSCRGSLGIGFGPGDKVVGDAKLGALADGVVPLLDGSPAIDAVDPASCPDVDQRGVLRPQGLRCDIGAYEFKPEADLSLAKRSEPAHPATDEEFDYTLTVANAGPHTASSFTVTDTLPAEVSFVSASTGCSRAGRVVTCNSTTALPQGQSAVFTIRVRAPSTVGDVVNEAEISASVPDDPDEADNTADLTTTVGTAQADLSLQKTGPSAAQVFGRQFEYGLTVTNSGPNTAKGFTVTDTLPAATTFDPDASSDECMEQTPGIVTCVVADDAGDPFGKDETRQLTVAVTAPSTAGTITNTATITAFDVEEPAGTSANNTDVAVTEIVAPRADLRITKTGPAAVEVGGTVTYEIRVRNLGPQTATSYTVTDPLPPGVTNLRGLSSGCDPGVGTVVCSGAALAVNQEAVFGYTVTAPSSPGAIVNRAARTISDPTDAVPGNDVSAVTTQILPQGVDLRLAHTAPASVLLGGTYVLQATLTNAGPATATNVRLTETLTGGLRLVSNPAGCTGAGTGSVACTIASLAPGASATVNLTLKPFLTCGVVGTAGNDTINGGAGTDVICGGAGNDTIAGRQGNDWLYGYGPSGTVTATGSVTATERLTAPGNENAATSTIVPPSAVAGPDTDTLTGGDGRDYLDGGAGNDTLEGGQDGDTIWGDTGVDTIKGGDGQDILDGGFDADHIDGGPRSDSITGGDGWDTISGGDADDVIDGGPGLDKIEGGAGGDTIQGGPDSDEIRGQDGADTLNGGGALDSIWGGDGNDTLHGGPEGGNYLNGQGGNRDACSAGPPPGDTRVNCERFA